MRERERKIGWEWDGEREIGKIEYERETDRQRVSPIEYERETDRQRVSARERERERERERGLVV